MNREKKEDSDSMFKGISKSRLHKMKWHEFATISLSKLEDRRKIDLKESIKDRKLVNRASNSMRVQSTDLSRYSEVEKEHVTSTIICSQNEWQQQPPVFEAVPVRHE